MQKKTIIIISLVVVLALGGTFVLAATEDGEFVNPFSKILGEKVEEGTITEEEADIFAKVWDAIKDNAGNFREKGMKEWKSFGEKPEIDDETMAEIKEAAEGLKSEMEEKVDEVIAGLISEGYIDEDEINDEEGRPFDLRFFIKDADEETLEAVKSAMAELKEYHKTLIEEKIESGELTEETAEFLMGGMKQRGGRGFFQGEKAWHMKGEKPATENDDN